MITEAITKEITNGRVMESAGTEYKGYVQARTDGITTLGVDGVVAYKVRTH
jgi:hypothetical protein